MQRDGSPYIILDAAILRKLLVGSYFLRALSPFR